MCGYGWGNSWSGGLGGVLATVLMVVLLIVVFAVRNLAGGGASLHHRGAQGHDGIRAEDRLADRFARGEIDEDEFQRRMTLLREHR